MHRLSRRVYMPVESGLKQQLGAWCNKHESRRGSHMHSSKPHVQQQTHLHNPLYSLSLSINIYYIYICISLSLNIYIYIYIYICIGSAIILGVAWLGQASFVHFRFAIVKSGLAPACPKSVQKCAPEVAHTTADTSRPRMQSICWWYRCPSYWLVEAGAPLGEGFPRVCADFQFGPQHF